MSETTKQPENITQLTIGYSINVAQFEQLKVEATASVMVGEDPDKVAAETNRYLKGVAHRLKSERLEEIKWDATMAKLERLNFATETRLEPKAQKVTMANPEGLLQKICDRILDLQQKPVVLEDMFKTLCFDYNALKALTVALMNRDVEQQRHYIQAGEYVPNMSNVQPAAPQNKK